VEASTCIPGGRGAQSGCLSAPMFPMGTILGFLPCMRFPSGTATEIWGFSCLALFPKGTANSALGWLPKGAAAMCVSLERSQWEQEVEACPPAVPEGKRGTADLR